MYCENCGNEINNAKFCSNCGNETNSSTRDSDIKIDKESTKTKDNEYVFIKSKWLGAFLLFTIKTTIRIKGNKINIEQQKKHIGFFNGKKKSTVLNITDIKSITNKKAIDLIDGIYAIIFGVLGIMAPPLLIVSLVCLWTGYGERILLEHNGIKTRIHTSAKCKTGEFIEYINSYR